jgi:ferredoxin/flavodoxin---NADP+ reductase
VIEASGRVPAGRPRSSAARPGTNLLHTVISVKDLGGGIFILRISRQGLLFRAGQWIHLGLPGSGERREYSIYSPPSADYIEVLVKEIPGGEVSPALRRCRPGDLVEVDGPHGSFTMIEGAREAPHCLFCATGTGVSPFHSFVSESPATDYFLLHGIRNRSEMVAPETYDPARFVSCISRGTAFQGEHQGRLTSYLVENSVAVYTYCYLCGNSDMIYEAFGILTRFGIPRERIFAEVYF